MLARPLNMARRGRIFMMCLGLAIVGFIVQSNLSGEETKIVKVEDEMEEKMNMKKTAKKLLMVNKEAVEEKVDFMEDVFEIRRKYLEEVCRIFKAGEKSRHKRSTQKKFSRNIHERKSEKFLRNRHEQKRRRNHHRTTNHLILTKKDYYYSNDSRLNQKPILTSHLLDHKRKIMYCWNHKVASSFWMWMFTKIEKGKEPPAGQPTYMIQYRMSPKTVSSYHHAVSTYQNILLVRHPLVRLISAYRDRVAGRKASTWLYQKIDRTIHPHRDRTRNVNGRSLHQHRDRNRKGRSRVVPTWPQFVQYLLTTSRAQDVSQYLRWEGKCLSVSTFILLLIVWYISGSTLEFVH